MGELDERYQHAEHEHFHHAPRAHGLKHAENLREAGRHPSQPQRQQQVSDREELQRGHRDGGQKHQHGDGFHLLVPERAHGIEQRGLDDLALQRQPHDREGVGDQEQNDRAGRQRQRVIQALRMVAIELGAAAAAARHAAARQRRLPLQQVALVAGDQRRAHVTSPMVARCPVRSPSPRSPSKSRFSLRHRLSSIIARTATTKDARS